MERVRSICAGAFVKMPPATASVELPTCHHTLCGECEECLAYWLTIK
jgi:hypothetical protein